MIPGTEPLVAMLAEPIDTRSIPVRNSHLKAIGRSPAHALYAMQHDFEPTLAMRLGSGCHSLLLGGPPVISWNGSKQRRGKDYDAWRATQPTDAIVLLPKDLKRCEGMANAVKSHARAAAVLYAEGTVYEQTIYWEQQGRMRRSTPDARSKSHLVELKSCRTAQPGKFQWDAIRMGYTGQLADYRNAMIAENGFAPKTVYIVAVEQLPPHTVAVYELNENALEHGERMCRGWLETLLNCEATGVFPGYCEATVEFDVPNDDEIDLTFGGDSDDEEQTSEEAA